MIWKQNLESEKKIKPSKIPSNKSQSLGQMKAASRIYLKKANTSVLVKCENSHLVEKSFVCFQEGKEKMIPEQNLSK